MSIFVIVIDFLLFDIISSVVFILVMIVDIDKKNVFWELRVNLVIILSF